MQQLLGTFHNSTRSLMSLFWFWKCKLFQMSFSVMPALTKPIKIKKHKQRKPVTFSQNPCHVTLSETCPPFPQTREQSHFTVTEWRKADGFSIDSATSKDFLCSLPTKTLFYGAFLVFVLLSSLLRWFLQGQVIRCRLLQVSSTQPLTQRRGHCVWLPFWILSCWQRPSLHGLHP